jgi:hypothetical protein
LLHPGEVFATDQEVAEKGARYHRLVDGRGWVFERIGRILATTEVRDFESGLWHYQCAVPEVEVRASASYADDLRTGDFIEQGDCVAIDERTTVGGARYLRLVDGRGWIFETKDDTSVFTEVRSRGITRKDFERGFWHYKVVCGDDVEIRAAPTHSDDARTSQFVSHGEVFAVDERCHVSGEWFVRLADGRGWLFETKQETQVLMEVR